MIYQQFRDLAPVFGLLTNGFVLEGKQAARCVNTDTALTETHLSKEVRMAKAAIPSPDALRQLLEYDPVTGRLTWLPRGDNLKFNARYAGREAFTAKTTFGHRQGVVMQRHLLGHRVAWAIHYGQWPTDVIDHIDRNPENNAIANLRDVTQSVNLHNCKARKVRKDSASGLCGVSRKGGKWRARVTLDGKEFGLGVFDTPEAAADVVVEFKKSRGLQPSLGGLA